MKGGRTIRLVWINIKKKMVKCYSGRRGAAVDGDTIKFAPSINGFSYARLPNIDTPEKGEAGFTQAKVALSGLIRGKPLNICPVGTDRTRVVAHVFAGNVDVTQAMKRKGW